MARMTKKKLEIMAQTIRDLKDDIKDKTEQVKTLEAALIEELGVGKHEAGAREVTVTPFHTLDSALIEKKFPADKHPDFYKLTVDTAEVKRQIPAARLEQYQKVSNRITVK